MRFALPVALQRLAMKTALVFTQRAVGNNYKPTNGASPNVVERLGRDIEGQFGEAGYCHFRGFDYKPDLNAFKGADVGEKTQVRATPHPNGRLWYYERDNDDHFFVLVRIAVVCEIVGWLKGSVARAVGEKEAHRPDGAVLYVPNHYLNTRWEQNERRADA